MGAAAEASRRRRSCQRKSRSIGTTLTCHAGLHQSDRRPPAGHAPRHSPFLAAFRYPRRGQRGLAGCCGNAAWLIRRRSWGSNSLRRFDPIPRVASRFREAASRLPFASASSPTVFAGRSVVVCLVMLNGDRSRMIWCGFRASLPSMVRPHRLGAIDPALGLRGCFSLSASFRVAGTRLDMLSTVSFQPRRSSPRGRLAALSALGFAAPFLRGCADLARQHPLARSRFRFRAPASPALQRMSRPTPRRSGGSIPAGPAPCLRFRTCPREMFRRGEVLGRFEPLPRTTITRPRSEIPVKN